MLAPKLALAPYRPNPQTNDRLIRDPRIRAALVVLHERPRLRTSQLAAIVKVGAERLRHLFKEEVGVSISQYSMRLRLALACELLNRNEHSLK